MTKLYTSPAAKARWEAHRAPRNRTDYALVSVAKQISMPRFPGADRARKRAEQRRLYELGLLREAEIGTDPIYQNTYQRVTGLSQAWRKLAKAWDRAASAAREAA